MKDPKFVINVKSQSRDWQRYFTAEKWKEVITQKDGKPGLFRKAVREFGSENVEVVMRYWPWPDSGTIMLYPRCL